MITGNDGNDTLEGRASAGTLSGDTLIGGGGDDLYIVDSITDFIDDSSDEFGDSVRSTVSFDLSNTLVGGGNAIEHLIYTGSNSATLTGNINANSIIGGSKIDLMTGGKGNDTYFVTSGDTVIEDTLEGGLDWVISNQDYILGENIEYLILDGAGSISGTGNAGANTIIGNAGANSINGGAGIDSLIGGAGNDTYFVDDIGDKIYETAGGDIDTVVSRFNGYALGDNLEHLILDTGVAGVINGSGNDLNNSLTGNAFSNNLSGDAGNDTLSGSSNFGIGEIDTLRGGTGADFFVIGNTARKFYSAGGDTDYAIIQDFNTQSIGGDKVLINGISGDYSIDPLGLDGYYNISVSGDLVAKVKTTGGAFDNTMFQVA